MNKIWITAKVIFWGLLTAMIFFLLVLFISQYRPLENEVVSDAKSMEAALNVGDTVKLMTWNLGYGALNDTTDFFMDGGTMVNTASETEVYDNLKAIVSTIKTYSPDIVLCQEADQNSKRSHYIDEVEYIQDNTKDYVHTFANNFKVLYIPYPIPTIGKVDCGIATYQKYSLKEAERIQLFCPFNTLVRAFNLRRCLLVNRIPIEDSDKELVVINLHLEAYDSGIGKIEQTKELKEYVENEYKKGNYVIAGGDFNQVFSDIAEATNEMVHDSLWIPPKMEIEDFENFTAVTDISCPTCRSLQRAYKGDNAETFPTYIIDGYLVSDNLEILQVETLDLDFKNSDHNPMLLKIRIK